MDSSDQRDRDFSLMWIAVTNMIALERTRMPHHNTTSAVVDTSVLVAGFKSSRVVQNPSASFLRDWIEVGTFTWLVTEGILSEYKEVLSRLGVRRNLVGEIINLLREEAEFITMRSEGNFSPDPGDNAFCACAEQGRAAFIATLNEKHFPQENLTAKVISPSDPIPTTRRGRSSGSQ